MNILFSVYSVISVVVVGIQILNTENLAYRLDHVVGIG